MHIGFLTTDLQPHHGWGDYGLSLLKALRDRDIAITLIAAKNSPTFDDPQVTTHRLLPTIQPMESMRLPRMLAIWPRVRALLADCDVIHTTCEIYAPLGAAAAGTRPHLLTLHGSYTYWPQIRSWPTNALYRWAYGQSCLVCVSHYTQQIAERVMPGTPSVVVPNGIDPAPYQNLPPLHNPSVTVPSAAPLIISVGGVKARKGTRHLVQAMTTVRQTLPDVQCVIIGDMTAEKGYVKQVQKDITRLELADTVHLTGFIPDEELLGWYNAADLFVMPSINSDWKFEGFGLVYLAAGAAGLPVIGTRDCGAEDAIDHGITGLLVSQEQIDRELPQAILRILTEPELAAEMGAAGRRHAESQTWGHVADQMIEVYEATLST